MAAARAARPQFARDLPRVVIPFLEDEQFVVGVGDAPFDRIHGHVPVRARPDERAIRGDLHDLLHRQLGVV
jgi:hypothetical protein